VPLACLSVAVAALVAALATGDPEDEDREQAFLAFPDSSGVRWQSLEEAGPLRVSGEGRHWLAFRAFSPGGGSRLGVLGDDGTRIELEIGGSPRIHFAGPLYLDGRGTYFLTPQLADGAPVFLSSYELTRRPLAALPGRGFWAPEYVQADEAFASWLNTRGVIDVAARDRTLPRAWLTFNVTSVDDERSVTLRYPGGTRTVRAPERGSTRRETVGPVPLTDGQGRVEVSSPDARLYGKDLRRRTVRLNSIEAHPAPPRG
jgi:hypothetical protein